MKFTCVTQMLNYTRINCIVFRVRSASGSYTGANKRIHIHYGLETIFPLKTFLHDYPVRITIGIYYLNAQKHDLYRILCTQN